MTVAGVNITPVAFLIVQDKGVKLVPVTHSSAIDKLLDYVPDLIDKVSNFINKKSEQKEEEKKEKEEEKDETTYENIREDE